jgi:biopolymer transport protein ExbD
MRSLVVALLFACVPPAEEASNAVIDPSSLVLPSSTSAIAANEDLPTVILTKSKLMVVGVPRGSMNVPITIEYMEGPIIIPLREWLKHPSIHGKDVAIAFDSDVTAETAMQVMATCLEAGMNVFHLAVSKEGTTAQIPLEFGKPDPPGARAITASIFHNGVVLKVPEGSVAPGCEALGDGVTLSRRDGLIARDRLETCVAHIHSAYKTTTGAILVTKDTEFHEVVTLLDALRKDASTEAISLGISN